MDPDQWYKNLEAFNKRMAAIDAHYQWRLRLIDQQRRLSGCFLTGYVVLLFAAIVSSNPVLMGAAAICMLVVMVSLIWMSYQLTHTRYPGGKP